LVEGLENSLQSSLIGGVSSEAEDVDKGAEIEVASDSSSVDDGEDLSGLGLEVEGLDSVDEFINGDVATAVVVEDVEDLLEFADRFGVEVLLDVLGGVEGWLSHGL
jgi:hypothetical protein